MSGANRVAILVGLLCGLLFLGCGRQSETQRRTYGYSNGAEGNRSINGYGAFRKMFELRGNKTFSAISFSRALATMDTIVWTPDTVTPPSMANRDTLEQWLSEKSGRTLVYIGRDFDASMDYWDFVVASLPTGQKTRAMREQMLARVESMENDLGGYHFARWFIVDTTPVRLPVQGLQGEWAEGIDVENTKLATRTELRPAYLRDDTKKKTLPALLDGSANPQFPNIGKEGESWNADELDTLSDEENDKIPDVRVLLETDDGRPLVFELTSYSWGDSKIIVLANGSFTLNGALVSKEHRKLASKVIDECKADGRVAFLRTSRNGMRVNDTNDTAYSTQGLEMFAFWPMNLLVYHFFILGIMICFIVYPIFGRPKGLPQRELSDFGHHIDALGGLLRRCGDEDFAREKLSDYFRTVRKEPNHPWCLPTVPKAKPTLQLAKPSDIPIEAEIITAQIQEKKS